jgi:hypothetical protein
MILAAKDALGWDLAYAGRGYSGTPATGSPSRHREELDQFLTDAIGPVPDADEKTEPADDAADKGANEEKAGTGKRPAVA